MNRKSKINGVSKTNKSIAGKAEHTSLKDKRRNVISFNFSEIDKNQGQTIQQWVSTGYVPKLFNNLVHYCGKTLPEAQKGKFTIYGDFPKKSGFKPPLHVSSDAIWAAFHIGGKEVVGGHLIGDVFYVVFLDSEHLFWISQKKHT